MYAIDPRLRNSIGLHPRPSDVAAEKREAFLRIIAHHFTASEIAELRADLEAGKLDVRLYDDAIVLMRRF
jgi:hypothetical protein